MKTSATLVPPVSAQDHIQGPSDAPVTLVEYGDYQCPYCGEAHPVVKRLQKALGKQLRFVFRNFPLTQAHPYAMIAAELAEAAGLQGKFWQMHDWIFEHQDDLEPDILPSWAEKVGLDLTEFGNASKQEAVTKRILEDVEGADGSGVDGTPCFFINGTRYDGETDYDSLRTALRQQLIRD